MVYWVILALLRLLRLRSIQFAAGPFLSNISTLISPLAYVTQHGIGDAWSIMTMMPDDDGHEEVMLTTTLGRGDHVFRAALQQRLLTTTSVMQHTRALLCCVLDHLYLLFCLVSGVKTEEYRLTLWYSWDLGEIVGMLTNVLRLGTTRHILGCLS